MRSGLVNILVRQLRRSAGESEPRHTDADLVRRFATDRDPEAFAELVHRHGPLVWGVCRRSLANRADAEDAFQATFLVFAKNAGSIRKPEALGAWLHGVAHRVAQRMRLRGESLQTDPVSSAPSCLDALTLREFLAALDDELAALPDKYRGPLVLCFLQERTQDDAAKRLGVSLSTLKRRLDAGRELLRGRLTRRGVELPGVLLAAGLGGGPVPAALAEGVVRAATVGVAGVVSANVLTITEGVIQAMWETKLRTWVVGILMATAAAGGTGYFAYTGQAQNGAGKQPANTPAKKVDPNERLRAAELDAAKAEIMIAEAMVQRAEKDLGRIRELVQAGAASVTELSKAEGAIEEAKAKLLRARAQFEITLARMEAEKMKAALDIDLRRLDEEKDRYLARERLELFERAFAAQTMQPELQKLKVEMLKSATETLNGMTERHRVGSQVDKATHHDVYQWSRRVMDLEQELDPANKLKAIKAHYTRMRKVEDVVQERPNQGSGIDRAGVHVYRLEAEVWAKQAEAGAARNFDPRLELSRSFDRIDLDATKTQFERVDRDVTDRTKVQTDDLAKRLTLLEQEVRQSRDEAQRAKLEAVSERERADALVKRVAELTDMLKKGNSAKTASAPEALRGKVVEIDGDLLTISINGVDADPKKGEVLELYRIGTSSATLLGKVTILTVSPKVAVGRFTSAKAKPPADEMPTKGDELRSGKVRPLQ